MSFDALPSRSSKPRLPTSTMEDLATARDNIPGPPGLPFLGNVLDIQDEVPIRGLENMIDIHGPIVKFSIMGRERLMVGNVALLSEICDEKRFWKTPGDSLDALSDKPQAKKGLFTAPTEDDMDWQQAHRTLMPAFGPLSIQGMFDEMVCVF